MIDKGKGHCCKAERVCCGRQTGDSIASKVEFFVCDFYHIPKGTRKNETHHQQQNLHRIQFSPLLKVSQFYGIFFFCAGDHTALSQQLEKDSRPDVLGLTRAASDLARRSLATHKRNTLRRSAAAWLQGTGAGFRVFRFCNLWLLTGLSVGQPLPSL